jgi:hypothetical protein
VNAPPGESRSIPIDTTTGTWMNLDVSPDGRSIASGEAAFGAAAVRYRLLSRANNEEWT